MLRADPTFTFSGWLMGGAWASDDPNDVRADLEDSVAPRRSPGIAPSPPGGPRFAAATAGVAARPAATEARRVPAEPVSKDHGRTLIAARVAEHPGFVTPSWRIRKIVVADVRRAGER